MAKISQKTQPEKVKTEKYYQLTNTEWVRAVHELTESEKDVLYYIRTLDPFGDRYLDLGVRQIARTLGYNPSTISRALHSLESKEFIDMEMTVRVKVRSKGRQIALPEPTPEPPDSGEFEEVLRWRNSVASEQQVLRQNNNDDRSATRMIAAQHQRSQRNTQALDPLSEAESTTPHTLKTFKTPHTLLNSTGEDFNFQNKNSVPNTHVDSTEALVEDHKSKVKHLQNPIDSFEDNCSANRSGGVEKQLPIYRTGTRTDEFNESFVEFIRRWLCSMPPERDRARGDALAYIRNQESSGDFSVINCRADEWRAKQQQVAKAEAIRDTLGLPLDGNQAVPEPLDMGDVLLKIKLQLSRLNWKIEDAIAHMIDKYDWSPRHPASKHNTLDPLTDEDLLALLEALTAELR